MSLITKEALYGWCKIAYDDLESRPDRKAPFRLCRDSAEMGQIMARELVDEIRTRNEQGEPLKGLARAPVTRLHAFAGSRNPAD